MRSPLDDANVAAGLVLVREDLADDGWRALPADAGVGEPPEGGLGRLLRARVPEEHIRAVADSPMFVRPAARLAYSSAAVFRDQGTAADACAVVGSGDFADEFARSVADGVVVAPGGAELLGSSTRRIQAGIVAPGTAISAHRSTFGGVTAEHVVPVHIDLVVLRSGRRLVLVWLGDAPDPFPEAGRTHLLARLAGRIQA